ncbi:MAG: hypothetical protein K1X52_01650 [Pyrinomonadaceae bacterium]|nr:hypothetical protein [Pyrinomonadaceae bacterium]
MPEYTSDNDVLVLVESFENATISREEWKHREHLVVALYYVAHFDLDAATEMMRRGILRLLEHGFGVDLEKDMPYHETLTVFWMNAVHAFWIDHKHLPLADIANEIAESLDKDHPLKFYTRELLFSDEARGRFVEPDLA